MVEFPDPGTRRCAPAARPRTPFRGQVYVALQSLRRRPLASLMRRLEEREQLSPEALGQLHRGELKAMLEYAHTCVPLYKTGPWKEALSAGASGDIVHWPLLDKETLRERVGDLRAVPAPKRLVTRHTSGSTGRRMAIVFTPEADVWGWAHRYRGLLWHGIPIGVPSLRMTHARRPLRDLVKGEKSVPALDSAESVDRALRYLLDERPELVAGPPSVLFQFARHLRERNIVGPLAPFARVGGEQCFDFQRREIESRLCSRVIDSYGCRETGALAGECPAGSLHIYVDHVHLEIFDGGEPVSPGEIGEIVVTELRNAAMPLVRYMVGDRARLTGEPCRCGLPHPVLTDLQARSSNMMRAADGGMRHASELVEQVGSIFNDPLADGIRQFQITQTDAGGWEVALEAPAEYPDANDGAGWRGALEDRISAIVRRFCGDDSRVAIRFTTSIKRENGKLNYLRTAV
jgi:phenylacetate-CoA ligase